MARNGGSKYSIIRIQYSSEALNMLISIADLNHAYWIVKPEPSAISIERPNRDNYTFRMRLKKTAWETN